MVGQIRLLIVCEGQTEATFVKRCLAPRLGRRGIQTWPSLIRAKLGKQGGGNVTLPRVGQHLANEYPNYDYLTTLVDLYGFIDRQGRNQSELEDAIRTQAVDHRPEIQPDRVIPYVQQYEFEALLFSDIQGFQWVLDGWSSEAERKLHAIAKRYPGPEHINDDPSTAPSKRLEAIFGGYYRKTEHGPIIAEEIGLEAIGRECPGFGRWVRQLEELGQTGE